MDLVNTVDILKFSRNGSVSIGGNVHFCDVALRNVSVISAELSVLIILMIQSGLSVERTNETQCANIAPTRATEGQKDA